VLAVASCSGGSSSDSNNAPVNYVRQPAITNYTDRQVDIYYTSVADKAVIFLHGGGGTNYGVAYELGLNSSSAPPNDSSVNWDWLNDNKVIAVFPQGEAATPGGTTTWSNHVMTSGQDDVAFLQALAQYVKNQYGISKIYLAGHSNGGMMVNTMWCESADTFDAYISFAGPASDYYSNNPNSCSPSTAKPYFGLVGNSDSVLQVTAGNWTGPATPTAWTINPNYVAAAKTPSSFIDKTLIPEWVQQQTRIDKMGCGEQIGNIIPSQSGNLTTWTNCNGRLVLNELNSADHWIYSLPGGSTEVSDSLTATAGSSRTILLDMAVQFISAIGG
jgi:poly(3-hydroxybutyrate) depolymerase